MENLGEEISLAVLHHQIELNRFIAYQTEKSRRELLSAIERWISSKLLSKEEEIANMERINKALEERLRRLSLESQLWREIAEANEEKAIALREDLERVIEVQDEESRCDGGAVVGPRKCWGCGGGAVVVLLLPCRHLCLCAACGPTTVSCPVCACDKNGSVNVNVS